jgi:hypothetical protein
LTMVFGGTPNPSLVIGQSVPFSGLAGSLTMTYRYLTPLAPSLVTAHAITLSGLAPGTVYHYQVRSRNAAGYLALSADFTFTTLAISTSTPATAPPTGSPAGSAGPSPSVERRRARAVPRVEEALLPSKIRAALQVDWPPWHLERLRPMRPRAHSRVLELL